jgi:choline dehydrogenase-like flavoprotein
VLHANATHINLTSGGGQLESIEISTLEGKRCIVKSRAVVLCCGGIENARLLLASNRIFSRGVGNQNDMVGRFLMDHTSVRVGRFELSQSFELRSRFGAYWLDDERGRHHYLHGFGLSREAQENEHLLNCHAHISGFVHPEANPWTALGRLKSSMKSARISASDVRVVFNHLGEVVKGLSRRQFKHRPEIASVQSLWLELMVEQIPDPWSRVTLSPDKKDALGMPLSSLHWKLSDSERMTASRLIASVCEELKHLGLPPLNGIQQLDDYSQWVSLCYERAHPAGTTRMSSYPRDGVVDANCQVHEVEGLFVAGSSVFPTSGAANPTLMVVAIALRVADYLKAHIRKANVRSVDTRFPLVDESVKAGMA